MPIKLFSSNKTQIVEDEITATPIATKSFFTMNNPFSSFGGGLSAPDSNNKNDNTAITIKKLPGATSINNNNTTSQLDWQDAEKINDFGKINEKTELDYRYTNFDSSQYRWGPKIPRNWVTKFVYRFLGPSPSIPSSAVFVFSSQNSSPNSIFKRLLSPFTYVYSTSFSASIYRMVPSLADRALESDLTRIETESVLSDTVKSFCLRMCEVSYEVHQDEDALPELVRMGHLLQKINSHRVYRENFRGLELVGVWVEGALWYHNKSDTLIAACRGTHTEEMNWKRDIGDGFLFGVSERVARLRSAIDRTVRSPNETECRRYMNSRLLLAAHSLGGSTCLRYGFETANINTVWGVVFNPGEIYMSFPRPLAQLLPSNRMFEQENRKFVIVRKPGDMISNSVHANCLIIDDDKYKPNEHRLHGFKPTLEDCASDLLLEHKIAFGVMIGFSVTALISGWFLRYILEYVFLAKKEGKAESE